MAKQKTLKITLPRKTKRLIIKIPKRKKPADRSFKGRMRKAKRGRTAKV